MKVDKEFRYSIRTKEGKLVAQQIVSFGSKTMPFPEDWKENVHAQMALQDYKQKLFDVFFDVTIEPGSELTE